MMANNPTSSDIRVMFTRTVNRAVLPQYPRTPKATVSITIDPARDGGDKSVEVIMKDGVIVKVREL